MKKLMTLITVVVLALGFTSAAQAINYTGERPVSPVVSPDCEKYSSATAEMKDAVSGLSKRVKALTGKVGDMDNTVRQNTVAVKSVADSVNGLVTVEEQKGKKLLHEAKFQGWSTRKKVWLFESNEIERFNTHEEQSALRFWATVVLVALAVTILGWLVRSWINNSVERNRLSRGVVRGEILGAIGTLETSVRAGREEVVRAFNEVCRAVEQIPKKVREIAPGSYEIVGNEGIYVWTVPSGNFQTIHVPKGAVGTPETYVRKPVSNSTIDFANFRKTMDRFCRGDFKKPDTGPDEFKLQRELIEKCVKSGEIQIL